jgi:2-dehydropantoate 2-reductase
MDDASILIVGGGAIGGVTAALLSDHVTRLAVLDPAVEHARLMRTPGLRVEIDGQERVVALQSYVSADELDEHFDFALVTVKAHHVEAALAPLHSRQLVDTYVSLGNGMVQPRVAEAVGADHVMAGVIEFGASNRGPGHVARTSHGALTIGELDGVIRPRTRRLATLMAPVGEIHLTDNVAGAIWSKLILNSTMSALGALSGLTTGGVIGDPDGRRASLALWREGYEAAQSAGIQLEPVFATDPREMTASIVGPARAEARLVQAVSIASATKASMLQDLERGVLTEVDVINGAVDAQSRKAGLDAPVNKYVLAAVHEMERGERQRRQSELAEAASRGPY